MHIFLRPSFNLIQITRYFFFLKSLPILSDISLLSTFHLAEFEVRHGPAAQSAKNLSIFLTCLVNSQNSQVSTFKLTHLRRLVKHLAETEGDLVQLLSSFLTAQKNLTSLDLQHAGLSADQGVSDVRHSYHHYHHHHHHHHLHHHYHHHHHHHYYQHHHYRHRQYILFNLIIIIIIIIIIIMVIIIILIIIIIVIVAIIIIFEIVIITSSLSYHYHLHHHYHHRHRIIITIIVIIIIIIIIITNVKIIIISIIVTTISSSTSTSLFSSKSS